MLGYEDHGILTAYLHLKFSGTEQGFGGYSMDAPHPSAKKDYSFRRIGTAFGCDFIIRVLKVVGVEKWEELKGKYVRADHDWGKIYRIGNIITDEWFDPQELALEHQEATCKP